MRYKLSHYDNDTPIQKIHLTYLKLQKRIDERQKIFSDFIKYIPTVIKPTNDKYNIFFYYNDKENEVGKIIIDFDAYHGGWGFSKDRPLKGRNERLDYLEDTELKFELGEKFKELEKLSRNHFCAYFKDVLINKIKKIYFNKRNYEENIKEIFIINGIRYLFNRENSKYDLINLDEKKPIIIN
jgi:hypothetical protein